MAILQSIRPNQVKAYFVLALFIGICVVLPVNAQFADPFAPSDLKDPFGGGSRPKDKVAPDPFGKQTVDPFGAAQVKPADPLAGIGDPAARERAKKVLSA